MEQQVTTSSNLTEIFGDVISTYTRAQAIDDGFLVDVTEWASADKGFIGGFKCPVAVTREVWADIERCPKMQDVRGRAHDVLWMASLAARGNGSSSAKLFSVIMQVGRTKRQIYKMVAGGGDHGELVITIMKPDQD